MAAHRVFVLLIGHKERGDINHFQLLQENAAMAAGPQQGIDVEVAFAPGFDQLRVLKRRLIDLDAPKVDAVVTEPASTAAMDLMLRELKGKTGLVILSAWGPSIEENAASWGAGLPLGNVSTDHRRVGQIQGRQVRKLLPGQGRVLCIAGPARSSAAQQRLEGLKGELGDDVEVLETFAGAWTESDGIVAFNDWYRVARSGDPVVQVVAGGNDELAIGARQACEALASSDHHDALLQASFLGVDGCPTFGRRLVEEGSLTATVVTPANTGLALEQLARFWVQGNPMPLRSFTEATPFPFTSAG